MQRPASSSRLRSSKRHTIAAWLAAACVVSATPLAAKPVPVQQGLVEGTAEDGLTVYRGIPYAVPPVGDLRWRAPRPAPPWEGVLEADKFAPACPQTNPQGDIQAQGEDCLYLNVWTPAERAGQRLPVLVWIHGGGFVAGAASERLYHGEALAKKGVVVVSMNYRLGTLGYLAHPALSAETPEGVSGNYGLLDMIEALRWIRANIAAFGGDPDRITISGESAGGIAVSMLAASPLTQGLFHGAISQSGGSFGTVRANGGPGENVQPLAAAEQAGQAFAAKLGATSPADLRRVPVEKVLDATRDARGSAWPIMDGRVIPDNQYTLYQAGRYNDTPILIGYNSDEGLLFGPPRSVQAYHETVRARYGPYADALLARYPAGADTVGKPPRDLLRDTTFGWHTWSWARLQSETGRSKAFLYYFAEPTTFPADSPFAGLDTGAVHAAELPYVFDHFGLPGRPEARARDRALSKTMIAYWTNFAKTGDPNGSGLPAWPAYDDASPRMMHFTADAVQAGPLVDPDGLKALDGYFKWRREGGE